MDTFARNLEDQRAAKRNKAIRDEAFELADTVANFGGYAEDENEAVSRALFRDKVWKAILDAIDTATEQAEDGDGAP